RLSSSVSGSPAGRVNLLALLCQAHLNAYSLTLRDLEVEVAAGCAFVAYLPVRVFSIPLHVDLDAMAVPRVVIDLDPLSVLDSLEYVVSKVEYGFTGAHSVGVDFSVTGYGILASMR
ncbi:hypothetical protein, partial [Streptomyces ipomoeae]|uniref:hypothetical protein n=1 Tax=Streptomyces ipomoeae TaxID=103232 RepID=UPI001F3FDD5A